MMLDDKILKFFKESKDYYVSGEEMSKAFGISRTAIWKHIEKLRIEGYDIISSPHLGYRLVSVPDRLTEIELKWQSDTGIIGRKIYSYREVVSTNDTAYNLGVSGEKEGAVVIAEYQTEGRGRLGRKWISPRGRGAYLSVLLRPCILPIESSLLTILASLCVAKTIQGITSLHPVIKWPNDILVNGQKVCGILLEMNGEIDRVHFIILGIGININTKKELLPEGGTSLAIEKGEDIDRLGFVRGLLSNLDKYYQIFNIKRIDDILQEYKDFSSVLYKDVQINYNNRIIKGNVVDIDKDGALVVRMDTGFYERVLAGDVVMLRG